VKNDSGTVPFPNPSVPCGASRPVGGFGVRDRLAGILLGTAVGDALGLPAEGLRPDRSRRLWPGPRRHRFLFGRGMLSDDTEHAFFVGQALLENPHDPKAFQRALAWRLRWWFLGLPAGIGKATLRACVKLCLGFPPSRSGVHSAGNGAAMRVALIGGYFHDDDEALDRFARTSTQLTHTDPRAATGALAVARLAAWAIGRDASQPPEAVDLIRMLASLAPDDAEWRDVTERLEAAFVAEMSVSAFADSLGLQKGVTGYVYHTVPVAVYAWLRHYGDFRATLEAVLDCGGDTDTVGAIAGALAGATSGGSNIPSDWIDRIWDWPRSVALLRKLVDRLAIQKAEGGPLGSVSYFWPGVVPRNLLFLLVVLLHGFRRLLPPY